MQDINCKSCFVYIYADIALKEGKWNIQMSPTLLYYWTALLYLDMRCPSCQLVFYKQPFYKCSSFYNCEFKPQWRPRGHQLRMLTLLWMKLERISHMLLVKKTNMNFSKMLFLNATVFIDNYWKIDWYKSWKK